VLPQTVTAATEHTVRLARRRHFLMCPPTHFDVGYSINPWMEPDKPTDTNLAIVQWKRLRDLYRSLGHEVTEIAPRPGLPDMVFAANGGTVVAGAVLSARFRYAERAGESGAYLAWFRNRGYDIQEAEHINEGEGDYLVAADRILAGTGFRTDPRSHQEAQRLFGRPVVTLTLVDPRFYHLDTALAVLDHDEIMYYPAAFSAKSRSVLQNLYPDAILATAADAEAFGLNAVSDGRHVVLAQEATHLIAELEARGFVPYGVDLSELRKSGGGAKCCTLELRPKPGHERSSHMNRYDGKRFRSTVDGAGADGRVATYRQDGDLLWGEFSGGDARRGALTGICGPDGALDFAYSIVLASGEVISGHCRSTPTTLDDGRIRLHETWERFGAHADTGVSWLEEVEER